KISSGNLDKSEVDKAIKNLKKYFPKGIPECGSDALRFGLLAYTSGGKDINFDIEHIIGCRNFCTKIWNAVKYVLLCLGENYDSTKHLHTPVLTFECSWILQKLNCLIKSCNDNFENYNLANITIELRTFLWTDFCDTF